MFGDLLLSIVLVDFTILLFLLMIFLVIVGLFRMSFHSKLLNIYYNFVNMVKTQFSKHIKVFWFDNTLEYTQHVVQNILHSYGIVHQLTYPGSSQQNKRVEQKFLHILETVHALMGESCCEIPLGHLRGRSCYWTFSGLKAEEQGVVRAILLFLLTKLCVEHQRKD